MAARCIAVLAKRDLVSVVRKLPKSILPFVNAADSITKRQGGLETIAALVDTLKLEIIPYIVVLVIPLLGSCILQIAFLRWLIFKPVYSEWPVFHYPCYMMILFQEEWVIKTNTSDRWHRKRSVCWSSWCRWKRPVLRRLKYSPNWATPWRSSDYSWISCWIRNASQISNCLPVSTRHYGRISRYAFRGDLNSWKEYIRRFQ